MGFALYLKWDMYESRGMVMIVTLQTGKRQFWGLKSVKPALMDKGETYKLPTANMKQTAIFFRIGSESLSSSGMGSPMSHRSSRICRLLPA